jgi:hypothetical protein
VAAAIFEQFRPWAPATIALPVSTDQKRVLVSFSIHFADDESEFEMTYMIFPDVFENPATFVLHQRNDGPVGVEAKSLTIWEVALSLALAAAISIVSWMIPRVQRAT